MLTFAICLIIVCSIASIMMLLLLVRDALDISKCPDWLDDYYYTVCEFFEKLIYWDWN